MTEESMNLFWKQKEKPSTDYSELENNVTHALLVSVREDLLFLNAILKNAGIKTRIRADYKVHFQVSRKRRFQTFVNLSPCSKKLHKLVSRF